MPSPSMPPRPSSPWRRVGALLVGAVALVASACTSTATEPLPTWPGVAGTWMLQGSVAGGRQTFTGELELAQQAGPAGSAGILTASIVFFIEDPIGGSFQSSGCSQPVVLQPAGETELRILLETGGQASLRLRLQPGAPTARGDGLIAPAGSAPLGVSGLVATRQDSTPSLRPACRLRP